MPQGHQVPGPGCAAHARGHGLLTLLSQGRNQVLRDVSSVRHPPGAECRVTSCMPAGSLACAPQALHPRPCSLACAPQVLRPRPCPLGLLPAVLQVPAQASGGLARLLGAEAGTPCLCPPFLHLWTSIPRKPASEEIPSLQPRSRWYQGICMPPAPRLILIQGTAGQQFEKLL